MTCLRFYVLYIISVSSGRRKGDDGKQCAMKSRLPLKRFPSSASVGNRARDGLIIKPALNPNSATGRIVRQRDRVTANQRDGQIIRERERQTDRQRQTETERERWKQLYLHCSNFTAKLFKSAILSQSVGHLTRKSGVLGSIPGLATYFRFSFRFFKKGSCQLLAKVCARSTG